MPKSVSVLGSALLLASLAGCAKDIKPEGPVITPFERGRDFAKTSLAPAQYSSGIPPLTKTPVLPFMGFGTNFDVGIVLGTKSDDIDMLEIARMQSADGPMWMVLQADAKTKDQTIFASSDAFNTLMPELPLTRRATNLYVQDKTTTDGIDLSVKYDNADNRPVEMVLQGQPADKLNKKRNGNAMGHSANTLLAALDVSSSESLFKADVRIDDQNVRMRKTGLVPFQYAVTSAMGGIATGEYFQEPTGEISFGKGAKLTPAAVWTPAPPPVTGPVIPPVMNAAGDTIVLLPVGTWPKLDAAAQKAALDAQTSKIEGCLAADSNLKGVVAIDLYAKDTKAWEITVHPDSTGSNIVMTCAQTIASAWTFDEKVDGGLHLVIGKLPEDHVAKNALEQSYLDMLAAEAAAVEAADAKGKDGKKAVPDEARKKALEDKAAADKAAAEKDAMSEDLLDDEVGAVVDEITTAAPLAAFNTVHTMQDGTKIAQPWSVERHGERVLVSQVSELRTMTYEFLVHGEDSVLELRSIQVVPWGQVVPATAITFSPAIPDLRRPFNGKVTSNFVIDVGGQQNHVVGKVESSFGEAGVRLTVTPTAPSWAASRPMISTVNFENGMAKIVTRRVE